MVNRSLIKGDMVKLTFGLLLALLLVSASAQNAEWSYEGATGPQNWGELDAAYELCSVGQAQSPVDISADAVTEENIADLQIDYDNSLLDIVNNGYTLQIDYEAGSFITVNDKRYNLLQFHFHTPSEHALGGGLTEAEIHFVHSNPDAEGDLAVIGVLVQEGAENEALREVLANTPEEGEEETVLELVEAEALLPESRLVYRYSGSLTTPPCSQGVAWNVMVEPVTMSAEQIETLSSIIGKSNRPVQPLSGRTIREDTQSGN